MRYFDVTTGRVADHRIRIARSASQQAETIPMYHYDTSRAAADRLRASAARDRLHADQGRGNLNLDEFEEVPLGGPAPAYQAPYAARNTMHTGWPLQTSLRHGGNSLEIDAAENARKARVQEGGERDLEMARYEGVSRRRWCGRNSRVWTCVGIGLLIALSVIAVIVVTSPHV